MTAATGRTRLGAVDLPHWGIISFSLFSTFFAVLAGLRAYSYGISDSTEPYKLATLAINYFDFGAMRRGLAGSIVHLAPVDLRTGAFLFYVVANLVFIAEAAWIIARSGRSRFAIAAPSILVVAAILGLWAKDVGRTDVMIGALLAPAAVAAARGRLVLASALLSFGLFAHECSLIFGLPLIGAIVWARPRHLRPPASQWLPATALLCGCVLLYIALPYLPHSDPRQLVDGVRAKVGTNWQSDFALMNVVAGERGLRDSLCQNVVDPNFLINGASALVLITLCLAALAGRPSRLWICCLAATLPAYGFLWVITLDNSRWITLSLLNVWLICALADRGRDGSGASPRLAGLAFAAVLVLLHSPLVFRTEQSIFATSPLLGRVAGSVRTMLGRDARTEFQPSQSIRYCDPDWASVLDDGADVRR